MWYSESACSLEEFKSCIASKEAGAEAPHAKTICHKVPVYQAGHLQALCRDPKSGDALKAELATVLLEGAGAFVIKGAYPDTSVVDRASEVFNEIIEQERGKGGEDHFAKTGANARIWNALEKLCLSAPDVFADYYANPMIALAATAWLGPCYQMTSQVNVVRPGGQAQEPHCDYHLGFLSASEAQQYPAHVHQMSRALTLQAGIAHCDMPVESGPTKLLPFSQTYGPGYMAWRRRDFRDHFEAYAAQVPLEKGDALFFNPSLFHAAGSNTTKDLQRMANLLQISSAFGIAMERMDREKMSAALYPTLLASKVSGRLDDAEIKNAIACCAQGYAFPLSLDETPPVDGLAPKSRQVLMSDALDRNLSPAAYLEQLSMKT